MSVIGERLRSARLRSGLTQQELATRAGISLRTVREIERGRVLHPQPRSLRQLSMALGIDDRKLEELSARARRAGLWIGVLGPFLVMRDGVDLGVSAPMLRQVLALLALHPNESVGCQELIDVLWEASPPRSYLNLLHGYATRLRQLLGKEQNEATPLIRSGDGYRLVLETEASDLRAFEDWVDRATKARRDEPSTALKLLNEALELWRGPVLSGMGGRLTQHPSAIAAGRLRVEATLILADLALESGQPRSALRQLHEVAGEQPLHEGLAAQSMLVMASAGEQAAALAQYADLRRRLAADLGVEPGAEVRAAHLRVLRQDFPVHVSANGERRGSTPEAEDIRPAQLPLQVSTFSGREAYLRDLDRLLTDAERSGAAVPIAVIGGTAGVGKTALAVYWAHRVKDKFPDGELFVNLRGFEPGGSTMPPGEALRDVLGALGVPSQRVPESLEARAALYRSVLTKRRMLILMDNARDAEQVRPLLPGSPGCLVVVTSRNRLTGLIAAENAQPIRLDPLSQEEAGILLARRLGEARVAAEPESVAEVVARCAGLPLALAIVAARANTHPDFPLSVIANELKQARGDVGAFGGHDGTVDIRAVFSSSYEALEPRAARLFRLLGMHPGPDISVAAAASLVGIPRAGVLSLLGRLTGLHLISEHSPGRYAFHDLVRAYASELARLVDSEVDRERAVLRILDHYLHTAYGATPFLRPFRDTAELGAATEGVVPEQFARSDQALKWMVDEYQVLARVASLAADRQLDTHAWRLAWTIAYFCDYRGSWADWAGLMTVAMNSARRLADKAAEARLHRGLAAALTRLGRHADADTHLAHALAIADECNDPLGRGRVHGTYAWAYCIQRRYDDALIHAQLFFDTVHALDESEQAAALNSVGWCHSKLGNYEAAVACGRRALVMSQQLGDRHAEADTWNTLGYAHYHLGHHTPAFECYAEALQLFRSLGNRCNEAETLDRIGDIHRALGDTPAAGDAWQEALKIRDEFGDPEAENVRAKLRAVCGSAVQSS